MSKRIITTALSTLLVLSAHSVDRQYMDQDLKAASINKSVNENSISYYKDGQLLIFKPNPKSKSDKPEPFTCTIKPDGDLGKPKYSKELSKLNLAPGTVAYDSVSNVMYFSRYTSQEHDYALYQTGGGASGKGKFASVEKMRIDGVGTERGKESFLLTAGWNYRVKGLTGFRNPSLAKNGTRIYFTARLNKRKNGNLGSTDIYYIDKKPDGSWTYPQNAGKGINSYGRDDYAFCLGDTVMYYTSTRKGNVDIYKSYFINGEWIKGNNLPAPYNSHANDQNLIANENTLYMISNRDPKGHDDIYLFRRRPDTALIPTPVPIPAEPEPDPILEVRKDWNFVLFYFDFDKSVLTQQFLDQFHELVNEMKQFPGETFEIAGHCDQRGSDAYNMKLSDKRAKFVRKMLMEEGFPGSKLVTKAFGESVPVVADPKSEDEFQLNRRVEVRILPRVSASAQDTVRTSRDEAEKQMPADYKIDDTKASK